MTEQLPPADSADEPRNTPGNWYEQLLWELAGGPVSAGRMILVWVGALTIGFVAANALGWVDDPLDTRVAAIISIPYWAVLCPAWAAFVGHRRRIDLAGG